MSNVVALGYLAAAVCFILALRGLSSPATARQGNRIGIAGMAIAILFTLFTLPHASLGNSLLILIGVAIGGAIGVVIALRIPMTAMPQLIAGFHSLVGMAAVLVAAAALYNPAEFQSPRRPARSRASASWRWGSARSSARSPSPAR